MHAFVLAGGRGRRLAPISTQSRPKPFIRLLDRRLSLLQQTLSRLQEVSPRPVLGIVGNRQHRALLMNEASALQDGPDVRWLVLEPFSRNTGPAIVFAAMLIARHEPGMPLLFLPSDHFHGRWDAFSAALAEALVHVQRQADLCLFGLPADNHGHDVGFLCLAPSGLPHGDAADGGNARFRRIIRFAEKPDGRQLKELQTMGDVLVNAGMVLARADVIVRTAARVAPALHAACARAMETAQIRPDGTVLPEDAAWAACPDVSFDVAVLEKAENVVCCPCDTGWHDVGTWRGVQGALQGMTRRMGTPPAPWRLEGGSVFLRGNASACRGQNALAWAEGDLHVHLEGVGNVAVIAHGKDVLVQGLAPPADDAAGDSPALSTPWGEQRLLHRNEALGLQLKLLSLRPGARTSLQSHRHRSERLIVLEGELWLRLEKRVHHLRRGDSRLIPCGCRHRLENRGNVPVTIMEVQLGSLLSEDDIIRFDDDYGRI